MPQNEDSPVHASWLDVLVDPVRLQILWALAQFGAGTANELLAMSHTSERTLRRHIDALRTLGIVHEHDDAGDRDESPGRPPRRVSLDPRARESVLELFKVLRKPLGPWPRRS